MPVETLEKSSDIEEGRNSISSSDSAMAKVQATPREIEEQRPNVEEVEKGEQDPFLVEFQENDPENAREWTYKKKWIITFLMSLLTFISPATSSIVAPADEAISKDLGITSSVESQIVISIFILAYAVGPFILGPLSEVYGRRPVYQVTNLIFLAFNIGCGFAQTKTQLIVCRFFSGFGGSAPLSLGSGTIGDIWAPEERGKAMSIYTMAPVLGPSMGPIAGGFIAQYSTWRWAFWATSIADAVIAVIVFMMFKETYAPRILNKRAEKLRKSTGDERYHSKYELKDSLLVMLATNLSRPMRFVFTQPIIQVLGLYMAFNYGLLYILLTTFPALFRDVYHENPAIGGLHYIALTLGYVGGTQVAARLMDKIYKKLKERNNGKARPEYRTPLIVFGSLFVPIGCFWYGWSAQAGVHWIMPDIGSAIICFGIVLVIAGIQTYIVDTYRIYAASAVAAASSLRSLCGFAFPLFAPSMYERMGLGWGNTMLGLLAIVLGIPAPIILWKYGERIRNLSKFSRINTP
ncbi:probable drug/proton antiporter Yhk8p [Trichomonascus vanleenenianus]|uniref:MFS transporter n=1 Tax=Trichomonascus vanleenenianus TaxID=2268995 RepID=UPI003EC9FC16